MQLHWVVAIHQFSNSRHICGDILADGVELLDRFIDLCALPQRDGVRARDRVNLDRFIGGDLGIFQAWVKAKESQSLLSREKPAIASAILCDPEEF